MRFVIIGGGRLESKVRKLAAPLGQRLILTGCRPDGLRLIRGFDIGVNCSRYEGQSIALLELLGIGLPVVPSTCIGNRDLVGEGVGLRVPPQDPAALALAVLRLLGDAGLARSLGEAARREVERHHSSLRMAQLTGGLYESLLASTSC